MKTGIFKIKKDDEGLEFATILKNDGQFIRIEDIQVENFRLYHEKTCNYLWTNTNKVVFVNGKEIYKAKIPITNKEFKTSNNQDAYSQIIEVEDEPLMSFNELSIRTEDIFNLSNTKIPFDTKKITIKGPEVDNFNLKFNRFTNYENDKFQFINGNRCIQANFGNLFDKERPYFIRRLESVKSLFKAKNHLLELKFRPQWRLVSGLGGHSVYETSINLHHIYGVPFIPASSIKGVLRSWILISKFNNDESEAVSKCKMFCEVFGCPSEIVSSKKTVKSILGVAHQGKVCFFDGMPIENPKIVPDVMNPHYGEWYTNGKAPVDSDKPVPIFFLTVKDTAFQFLLGSKYYNLNEDVFWDGKTLGWWLINALSEHGIGAKTAVGYGYMNQM
jgi:CRISPR-associated protein Cmr6